MVLARKPWKSRRQREKAHELCSGPGKLVQALAIDGSHHGLPMVGRGKPTDCGLKTTDSAMHEVASDIRVGISQAVDFSVAVFIAPQPARQCAAR
jgi:DNA-3-methyladenine glycosylase